MILTHLYPFPAYLSGDSNRYLFRPLGGIQLRVVISSTIVVDGSSVESTRISLSGEHVVGLHSAIMVVQGVDGVASYALETTEDSKDNIEEADGNNRC